MKKMIKNSIEKIISRSIFLIKIYRNLVFFFYNKNRFIYNILYKIKPSEKYFLNNKNQYVSNKFKKFSYIYNLSQVSCNWHFFGINLKYDVYKTIHNKIRNSNIILDIGANLGFFSLECLDLNPNCKIYAFEPNRENYLYFKKNIELNKISKINLKNFGFYSSEKELSEVNQYPTNLGMVYYLENNQNNNIEKINFKTGDKFLKEEKLSNSKIDLIKIDVEGAEYHVLLGLRECLFKHKPVLHLEIDYEKLSKFNSSYENIISFLKECNYSKFEKINFNNDNRHYDMVCWDN